MLSRKTLDAVININLDMSELDLTSAESKATYAEIKKYVLDKFGLKVSQLYIAQVKREFGLIERINYNVGEGKNHVPQVTPEKREAIIDALKHFQMIPNAFERITEVSKLAELSGGEIIAAILVALLYLSSFISILCFMLSIIARVKNLNNASSAFFFGSIGNMTLENYKNAVKDMDEKEIVDDLEEQIHTNSKICSLKAKWYNKGIKFLLVTVILWFVCMIFQLI